MMGLNWSAVAAVALAATVALAPPRLAAAKDNGGGGGAASCYQCAQRIVWGHTTVFCESGYFAGFTTCTTVDVPGPQSDVNSCDLGLTCFSGKSWPFFSAY